MTKEIQDRILKFLYSNINIKFTVSQIHNELSKEKEISYNCVQSNILWLQYQRDNIIKIEWKHPYKLVWLEAGKNPELKEYKDCFCKGEKVFKPICAECN